MLGVSAAAGRVQWDKTSVVAEQGDNVTLECAVRAVDYFDVVRLTLTPSSSAHRPPLIDDKSWTIADNNIVKSPFIALPRYGVEMTIDGRRAVVRLQLTGRCPSPTPTQAACRPLRLMTLTNW